MLIEVPACLGVSDVYPAFVQECRLPKTFQTGSKEQQFLLLVIEGHFGKNCDRLKDCLAFSAASASIRWDFY